MKLCVGLLDKADFAYDSGKDVYVCPAGENLTYRSPAHKTAKPSERIGRVPVPIASSRTNARPQKSGAFVDGNMKMF